MDRRRGRGLWLFLFFVALVWVCIPDPLPMIDEVVFLLVTGSMYLRTFRAASPPASEPRVEPLGEGTPRLNPHTGEWE